MRLLSQQPHGADIHQPLVSKNIWATSDLIEGKSNGLHVFAFPPFLPAVLLHEANQEAAIWLAGGIWMLQRDLELRVEPEGCCETKVETMWPFKNWSRGPRSYFTQRSNFLKTQVGKLSFSISPHLGSSCSPLLCCLSSTPPGKGRSSISSDGCRAACRPSGCISPGERTLAGSRWRTSWETGVKEDRSEVIYIFLTLC